MKYFSWVQLDNEGRRVDPEPYLTPITVYEPDREPTRTGLLDKKGNQIMKSISAFPVGFMRFGA